MIESHKLLEVSKLLIGGSVDSVCWITHTHTFNGGPFPGLPGWAGTRKVKPIWILVKQETVSGSGISWAICKSAPHSRQITMQHPTTQFSTGRMPFLSPNQHHQSTEGTVCWISCVQYCCRCCCYLLFHFSYASLCFIFCGFYKLMNMCISALIS